MRLVVRKWASKAIAKTGTWVEQQNTDESGIRWITKVYETLEKQARLGVKHALCRDEDLAIKNYRCFTYSGNWVVAYRIEGDELIVYRFI